VVGAFALAEKDRRYLVTVAASGFAKKTALEEYPSKGRATGGVQAMGLASGDSLVGGVPASASDELVVWTGKDTVLRVAAGAIPTTARDRKGSRLADLPKGETVSGLAL